MIEKLICTVDIRQRPAMRDWTSSSARWADSAVKRCASSSERPIVLPSRMPETDSDSETSALMSASRPCFLEVIRLRSLPTRRVSQTKNGSNARLKTRQAPVEQEHRDDRREHRRGVGDDRRRGRRDDVLDAADVVGDPRLHLAGARAREEGEREALQVAVDGGAQVVHDALADEVRQPGLADADHAGRDRDEDHPADEPAQQRRVPFGDRVVEDVAQQKRRDHAEACADRDQPEHRAEPRPVGTEERCDTACLRAHA